MAYFDNFTPYSIEAIGRLARHLKKTLGLRHYEALDLAATRAQPPFANYAEAIKALRPSTKGRFNTQVQIATLVDLFASLEDYGEWLKELAFDHYYRRSLEWRSTGDSGPTTFDSLNEVSRATADPVSTQLEHSVSDHTWLAEQDPTNQEKLEALDDANRALATHLGHRYESPLGR